MSDFNSQQNLLCHKLCIFFNFFNILLKYLCYKSLTSHLKLLEIILKKLLSNNTNLVGYSNGS